MAAVVSIACSGCIGLSDGPFEQDPPDHDVDAEVVEEEQLPDGVYEPVAGNDLIFCGDGPSQELAEVADPQDAGAGQMRVQQRDRLWTMPLQRTEFDTVVVGSIAETEVTQIFANPLSEPIEAVYTFPLHEDAAVDDYSITVGDRTIRGDIKTREDARKTYEEAKEAGNTAGLLEQQRPNIFTQSVANIPPGEAIEITMHVVHPLEEEEGRYELVLPTVVGPRYVPGEPIGHAGTGVLPDTDRVPDASKISPPLKPEGAPSCPNVDIRVAIDAGVAARNLESKHHSISVQHQRKVTFVDLADGKAFANRDFHLMWTLRGNTPTATVMAERQSQGSDEGWFALTIQPPTKGEAGRPRARELVFVVDNSGSMSGQPMEAAKKTMRRALAAMHPDDAFQVMRFSESASALGNGALLPNDKDNLERGLAYVDDMHGMGGTNMVEGVKAALDLPGDPDKLRIVMFLTDGYIGNETEIFSEIDARRGDARLFSLGVGNSVNRYLLDGMAAAGRGSVTYVSLGDDPDDAVDDFYDKIAHPVLTDVEIDWGSLDVSDVVPAQLPDLFAGQPVKVYGRYKGDKAGEIKLRARTADASVELPVDFSIASAAIDGHDDTTGVRSVWARKTIDDLLGYPTPAYEGSAEYTTAKKAVTALALEHRILTQFTSFVAVDESRVVQSDGSVKTIVVPVEVPEGVDRHMGEEGYMGTSVGGLGIVGTGRGGGGVGYGHGTGASFGGKGRRVPKVRHAKAVVTGSLDKDIIRRIVRAHANEVRACYEVGLVKDPNLAGKVTIALAIGADGKVDSVVIKADTLHDEGVNKCLSKSIKRWKFPKPPGGGNVSVSHPFVFSPG